MSYIIFVLQVYRQKTSKWKWKLLSSCGHENNFLLIQVLSDPATLEHLTNSVCHSALPSWDYFKRHRDTNTQRLKRASVNCCREGKGKFNHCLTSVWLCVSQFYLHLRNVIHICVRQRWMHYIMSKKAVTSDRIKLYFLSSDLKTCLFIDFPPHVSKVQKWIMYCCGLNTNSYLPFFRPLVLE